jgi:hypothetical protein
MGKVLVHVTISLDGFMVGGNGVPSVFTQRKSSA